MITIDELKRVLDYNPETGLFKWKINHGRRGLLWKPAGYLNSYGRPCIMIYSKEYRAAKLAWAIYYGEWPTSIIDHKDRNTTNTRIINLRQASAVQNSINSKLYVTNTSGYRGVCKTKQGTYKANIRINGKLKHLGVFQTALEASIVYEAKAKELYGEFVGQLSR